MGKIALVLIVVVAAVLLYVLIGSDVGSNDYDPMTDGEHELDEDERAMLEGTGNGGRNGAGTGTNGNAKPPTVIKKQEVWFRGVVVDAKSGSGVPSATVWTERHLDPCPRMSEEMAGRDLLGLILPSATTDSKGRFKIQNIRVPTPGSSYDLFVSAPGYVTTVVCSAGRDELAITLTKALQLKGQVTDRHSRPIEGATIKAKPGPGLALVPGSTGEAVSDREGHFVMEGLAKAQVIFEVDHPNFMPRRVGPFDPGDPGEKVIQLSPAFRASFEIRTADGENIVNTTFQWSVSDDPETNAVQLLGGQFTGPPARPKSEMKSNVVRILCAHNNVDLEIKADGYAPWRVAAEPLPPDGGERVFQVELARDATVGSLRIKLVGQDDVAIPYMALQGVPSVMWLGEGVMRQAFVIQGGEDLYFPALPAGPYRIGVRSAKYGPGTVDVKVVARGKTEVQMKLGPPAKVRVRFTSRERVVVQFHFLFEGNHVAAFPEETAAAPDGSEAESLSASSGKGLVVSGLGAGRHVLEVLNPNLVPVRRAVNLTLGETTEVEIEVQLR